MTIEQLDALREEVDAAYDAGKCNATHWTWVNDLIASHLDLHVIVEAVISDLDHIYQRDESPLGTSVPEVLAIVGTVRDDLREAIMKKKVQS